MVKAKAKQTDRREVYRDAKGRKHGVIKLSQRDLGYHDEGYSKKEQGKKERRIKKKRLRSIRRLKQHRVLWGLPMLR